MPPKPLWWVWTAIFTARPGPSALRRRASLCQSFQASVGADGVFIGDRKLGGGGDVVIGIHDFTGNRVPEFVLAQRVGESIGIWVYALNGSAWSPLKMMSVRGAKEVRIFRQVISVRQGEALCSWTWHGDRFDYKASDGSPEPTSL